MKDTLKLVAAILVMYAIMELYIAVRPDDLTEEIHEWFGTARGPFELYNAGALAGGAQTGFLFGAGATRLVPANVGWEAEVTRISLQISGASNAATAILYFDEELATRMFDFASQFYIGSPSVNVADYPEPVYFSQGESIAIRIAAAASGATVTVRAEGRRREV